MLGLSQQCAEADHNSPPAGWDPTCLQWSDTGTLVSLEHPDQTVDPLSVRVYHAPGCWLEMVILALRIRAARLLVPLALESRLLGVYQSFFWVEIR